MHRLLRHLLLCLCTVAGFAGGAWVLHRALPLKVPEVTPKLDYLAAHRDEFDTVFIGSSRVYHGISPREFDSLTAAGGRATHSYNLAIDGMMPPESLRMTRALLALHPANLKRVFLEVSSTRDMPDLKTVTVRDVYWQDWRSLVYGLRRAPIDYHRLKDKYRWPQARADMQAAVQLFARNQFNIGRLIPEPEFEKKPLLHMDDSALGPDRDGFLPENHPLTHEHQAKLDQGLKAVLDGTAKARPREPMNTEGYVSIRKLLDARGVDLVLVTTPVTTRDFNAKQDAPSGYRLLAFDDPRRYPELYTPDHRFDYDHLNGAGAVIFSRELARAYLDTK